MKMDSRTTERDAAAEPVIVEVGAQPLLQPFQSSLALRSLREVTEQLAHLALFQAALVPVAAAVHMVRGDTVAIRAAEGALVVCLVLAGWVRRDIRRAWGAAQPAFPPDLGKEAARPQACTRSVPTAHALAGSALNKGRLFLALQLAAIGALVVWGRYREAPYLLLLGMAPLISIVLACFAGAPLVRAKRLLAQVPADSFWE